MLRWLALIALVLVGSVRVSSACSPPCNVGKVAPLDGGMVPADVPALWVYTPEYANNPARVTLTDDANTRVPIHVTTPASDPYSHLVVLDKPLEAGHRYRFVWPQATNRCDEQVPDATSTFTAVVAGQRPDAAGTLELAATHRGPLEVWTSSGSCSTTIGAAIADLRFTPSARAIAYLPLAAVMVKVDGVAWASVAPGEVAASGDAAPQQFPYYHRIDRVFAACPLVPVDARMDSQADTGLAPGRHHVELFVHVVGTPDQDDPSPAVLDVTLTCTDEALDPLPEAGCSCAVSRRTRGTSTDASVMLTLAPLALQLLRSRRRGRGAARRAGVDRGS